MCLQPLVHRVKGLLVRHRRLAADRQESGVDRRRDLGAEVADARIVDEGADGAEEGDQRQGKNHRDVAALVTG